MIVPQDLCMVTRGKHKRSRQILSQFGAIRFSLLPPSATTFCESMAMSCGLDPQQEMSSLYVTIEPAEWH